MLDEAYSDVIELVPLASIDANAATSIVNVSVAQTGSVVVKGSPFYYVPVATLVIPAYSIPTSVVITATGVGALSTTDACELECTLTTQATPFVPSTSTTTTAGSQRIIVCTSPSTSMTAGNFSNSFAFEQLVSLPINTSATYLLYGLCAVGVGSATTASLNSINLKSEVVKR